MLWGPAWLSTPNSEIMLPGAYTSMAMAGTFCVVLWNPEGSQQVPAAGFTACSLHKPVVDF